MAVDRHPIFSKLPLYWITRNRQFYLAIKDRVKEFDAILVTSALEALWLQKLAKDIPLLVMVNDDNLVNAAQDFSKKLKEQGTGKSISRRIHRALESRVCKRASCVVTNSDFTTAEVVRGYDLPPEKVKKLYKAVDTEVFRTDKSAADELPLPTVTRLLFLKNDYRRGGLDLLARSLEEQPAGSYALTVAGISPGDILAVTDILADAKSKLVNLEIVGLLDRPQVAALFAKHDLFVNMARQEALGVSCLEAMAAGLPVIASRIGGLPEVLDHGRAGYLIENTDAALSEQLKRLRETPDLVNEKRPAMRRQVMRFSRQVMAKRLEEILLETIDE